MTSAAVTQVYPWGSRTASDHPPVNEHSCIPKQAEEQLVGQLAEPRSGPVMLGE